MKDTGMVSERGCQVDSLECASPWLLSTEHASLSREHAIGKKDRLDVLPHAPPLAGWVRLAEANLLVTIFEIESHRRIVARSLSTRFCSRAT